MILQLVDFVLHVNVHLAELFRQYGTLLYGILFAIVFCETGLVFTPFLPGDSLLFASGALCASSSIIAKLSVQMIAAITMVAPFPCSGI